MTTPLPMTQVMRRDTGCRRDQVQLNVLAVAHDRVAGVVAALVADDDVGHARRAGR